MKKGGHSLFVCVCVCVCVCVRARTRGIVCVCVFIFAGGKRYRESAELGRPGLSNSRNENAKQPTDKDHSDHTTTSSGYNMLCAI